MIAMLANLFTSAGAIASIVDVLSLAFIVYAISYVAVDSLILEEPRNWLILKASKIKNPILRNKLQDLIGCRYCLGFHVAWIVGFAFTDISVLGMIAAYGAACLMLDVASSHD